MVSELVQGTLRKAIRRFAKKMNKTTDEVQLMIWWNEEEQKPNYKRLVEGMANEPITILDVLNMPIDIFNQGGMVAEFITKRYEEYSLEYQCPKSTLFVIIGLIDNDEEEILKAYLFKGNQQLKEINLEQFFT